MTSIQERLIRLTYHGQEFYNEFKSLLFEIKKYIQNEGYKAIITLAIFSGSLFFAYMNARNMDDYYGMCFFSFLIFCIIFR